MTTESSQSLAMASCSFIFIFLCLLIAQVEYSQSQATFQWINCSDTSISTYSPGSTFDRNLNATLSSLSSSNSSNFVTGFANATSGQGPADQVYGLFLCRGDVSASGCQFCVATATKDIRDRCPSQKVSTISYEECMLSYSNQSIFSVMRDKPVYSLFYDANISNPDVFIPLLNRTYFSLSERAGIGWLGRKFAVQKAVFTVLQNLYALAQCTPDLSQEDCTRCIQSLYRQFVLRDKQGARAVNPSCNIRYGMLPFYNETAAELLSPPLATSPAEAPILPPPSSVPAPKASKKISTAVIIAIVASISATVVIFFLGCRIIRRRRAKKRKFGPKANGNEIITAESLQFDFSVLRAATNNFSAENKLGKGGFGEVHKGVLPDGQVVALKRLSKFSGQGAQEFKMEVTVVAKLQHRYLVRLLGFCLAGEEKILVYEYVPNKSLDYFLFDTEKRELLDWSTRYKIISGIARGMLYLHEDSRLRIIHRDLKASNILLDADMNPKISDFGTARIFGVDETRRNTTKIVGTFGYMSPEYAMHGQFSVKSDVYSFGVLVLEIISGKKISSFYESGVAEDLPSYAWKMWRNDTPLELLDPILRDSCSSREVNQCIHMSLLCLQEDPADRPTMNTINLLLNSHPVNLAMPQQPALFVGGRMGMPHSDTSISGSDKSANKPNLPSVNEISSAKLYPR